MKKASDFFSDLGATAKSIVKIALQSRPCDYRKADNPDNKPLVILANGPSLRETIDNNAGLLGHLPTLAVNFAANAPEFNILKPSYYVLADPHFFKATDDVNVKRLLKNLTAVTWPMRLFIDRRYKKDILSAVHFPENVTLETFNAIGAEGFRSFEHIAYKSRLAMPRPRNVLIPSIMIGIGLGYNEIYVCGADHSWMRDIHVTDENIVVSGMSHFYKEDNNEVKRSQNEYRGYKLHQIIHSYYTAFLSYHKIRSFADSEGVKIYNSTKGSYIDAFERKPLSDIDKSR